MRKLWPGLLALALATAFGCWALGRLPDQVATHWNASGEADGWSSPLVAVLLLPAIALVTVAVLVVAPRVDPRRANFVMHSAAYWTVANVVLVFLSAVHVLSLGVNLGWRVDLARLVGGGIGVLFMVTGNLLSRVRPNWIFGIRTPWTLTSERAWRETHRYGGYGFVLAGVVILLTAIAWHGAVFPVIIGSVTLVALFSIGYSYFAWKRDTQSGASV